MESDKLLRITSQDVARELRGINMQVEFAASFAEEEKGEYTFIKTNDNVLAGFKNYYTSVFEEQAENGNGKLFKTAQALIRNNNNPTYIYLGIARTAEVLEPSILNQVLKEDIKEAWKLGKKSVYQEDDRHMLFDFSWHFDRLDQSILNWSIALENEFDDEDIQEDVIAGFVFMTMIGAQTELRLRGNNVFSDIDK